MSLIITAILFIVTLCLIFVFLERQNVARYKQEKQRFREFVIATKSDTLKDYVEVIPEDVEDKQEEVLADEFVDIDDVPADQLLNALKQNEDNENIS